MCNWSLRFAAFQAAFHVALEVKIGRLGGAGQVTNYCFEQEAGATVVNLRCGETGCGMRRFALSTMLAAYGAWMSGFTAGKPYPPTLGGRLFCLDAGSNSLTSVSVQYVERWAASNV